MAADINAQLQMPLAGILAYIDPTSNSCELGLELNDPSYYFTIIPPPGVDTSVTPRDRQLFAHEIVVPTSQQIPAESPPAPIRFVSKAASEHEVELEVEPA
jgi:hypothetical protein